MAGSNNGADDKDEDDDSTNGGRGKGDRRMKKKEGRCAGDAKQEKRRKEEAGDGSERWKRWDIRPCVGGGLEKGEWAGPEGAKRLVEREWTAAGELWLHARASG
jgi:hypothetical protein